MSFEGIMVIPVVLVALIAVAALIGLIVGSVVIAVFFLLLVATALIDMFCKWYMSFVWYCEYLERRSERPEYGPHSEVARKANEWFFWLNRNFRSFRETTRRELLRWVAGRDSGRPEYFLDPIEACLSIAKNDRRIQKAAGLSPHTEEVQVGLPGVSGVTVGFRATKPTLPPGESEAHAWWRFSIHVYTTAEVNACEMPAEAFMALLQFLLVIKQHLHSITHADTTSRAQQHAKADAVLRASHVT